MKRIIGTSLLLLFSTLFYAQLSFDEFLDSVAQFTDNADKIAFVEEFLAFAETQGIPYIEGDTAHFLYYNDVTSAQLAGDFNGWGGDDLWDCIQINGTDFYYYSRRFEMTARLDYKYIINGSTWS